VIGRVDKHLSDNHLSDDELLALVDSDTADDDHLSQCGACRRRYGEFVATLELASRLPPTQWSALQREALVHGVRRRLRGRPTVHRPGWQPALGGALATGVLAVLLTLTTNLTIGSPGHVTVISSGSGLVAKAAESVHAPRVVSEDEFEEELDETEVAGMIETYLMETASADELMWELEELSDDQYYALLDE
jgi:hypothetical protein